ncbi:MAG: hypothetical protein K0U86_18695 [Planctomycetes bacterium]|nr:hypothetical protein [Planctomycetota bacterium]MCH9726937.1 hypothetical protein [Planctomycetota bacterium]MCH9775621.1 hypothetical protein [Planctomycetota bacterium]
MRSSIKLILACLLIEHSFAVAGKAADKPCQVDVSKIGSSVSLIGKLGRPLGTKMKIKGTWVAYEADGEPPQFTITQVDGVQLGKPVLFYKQQILATTKGVPHSMGNPFGRSKSFNAFSDYDPNYSYSSLIGKKWTMMAYETGYISITHSDFNPKEEVHPSMPYWSRPFTPILVGVVISNDESVKQVDQAADKAFQIDASKIGSSVTLIGRLGKPLARTMQIKGTWVADKVKGAPPRLSITQVDGVKLDQPVVFYKGQIHATTKRLPIAVGKEYFDAYADYQKPASLIGEQWTMRAYETGFIGLTPNESKEKKPVWPVTNKPPWSRLFTSNIIARLISKK